MTERRGREEGPLWTPSAERIASSNLTAFIAWLRRERHIAVDDFRSLYRWSVREPRQFWPAVWQFCGIVATAHPSGEHWTDVAIGLDRMAPPDPRLGPTWFPGARLNFAENLLCYEDDRPAIVSWNERGEERQRHLTFAELRVAVAGVAAALRSHGVRPGDRVAGFLPNIPETIIAML